MCLIFFTPGIYITEVGRYKIKLIVNSGAWQKQTKFQQTMGINPTPGICILVNLGTNLLRKISIIDVVYERRQNRIVLIAVYRRDMNMQFYSLSPAIAALVDYISCY